MLLLTNIRPLEKLDQGGSFDQLSIIEVSLPLQYSRLYEKKRVIY